MKEKIIQAIEEYVNEPDSGFVRAVPDPEVLADWIIAAL